MQSVFAEDRIRDFLACARDVTPEGMLEPIVPRFDLIAMEWMRLGLSAGDIVILMLPNGVALLDHWFGAITAGLVPVLVAPNVPSARVRELARRLGAAAVAARTLPNSDIGACRTAALTGLDVALFVDSDSHACPGEAILLTSGTSGFASGCVFGVDALLLNAQRHAEAVHQTCDDVVLVNLPLQFSYALVAQALATFVTGGTLLVSGPPFNAGVYRRIVDRGRVSISSLTPVLMRSLLQDANCSLAGLRALTVGGDSLAPLHVRQFLERHAGIELYLTYGITQAGPRVSTLAAHAEPEHRFGSVGTPLAGTEVTLRDLGDGTDRRELLVSSATVTKRLISGGADCRSLVCPGTIATGDVFQVDPDGYLYFQGRLGEFIVRGGEKVFTADVRRVASQIPGVIRAATTVLQLGPGQNDFDLDLTVATGASVDVATCRRHLRTWLRSSEMPRTVRVMHHEATSARYK